MPTPHRHLSVDELSHRASTGLAIRRGDIKISEPIPSSYVHNGAEMDGAYEQSVVTPRLDATGTWSGRSGSGAFHGRSGSTPLLSQSAHASRFTERTSLGPSLSISNISSAVPKDPEPQRKDTGLRASLKRMFSKKNNAATAHRRTTHQSDPVQTPAVNHARNDQYYQSSPVGYNNVTPGRPLASHATHPQSDGEVSLDTADCQNLDSRMKRRNTVPDLLADPTAGREETSRTHPRVTYERPATSKPSVDNKGGSLPHQHLNRRSRSADALTELLRSPLSRTYDRRDRSEEIAYWRNSVIIDPLPRMPLMESSTSLDSVGGGKLPDHPLVKQPRPSIEPVQDFDFGLNDGSNLVRPTTLQERVNTLEIKLYDFEYALVKLQGTRLKKRALPRKRCHPKSATDNFAESGDSSPSTNDTSHFSSPQEAPRSFSPTPQSPFEHVQDRTSKATTVKQVNHRRTSNRSQVSNTSIHITYSQYDTLRALIESEKIARQRLEREVTTLQREVETLKTPGHAETRPAHYPTPSPDSFQHSRPLTTSKHARRSFEVKPLTRTNETSRFSMSETEPETEVGADERNTAFERSPDVYETPKESTFRFDPKTISPSGMF